MNGGFFSFPSLLKDNPLIKLQEFDASGTFVIPSFARRLYVLLVGAGGSGGGGARYASGTSSCGGSGGAGGRYFIDDFSLDMVFCKPGMTLSVVIGAGGSGAGTGATADGTNGLGGSPGGNSSITITGKPGNMFVAYGGAAGAGGTNSTSSTGAAGGTSWCFSGVSGTGHVGGNGADTNFPQGPGTTPNPASSTGLWNWQSNGGCGGGGVNTSNTASSGGAITAGSLVCNNYATIYGAGNNIIQPGAPNTVAVNFGSGDSYGYTLAGAYTPGLGGVGGGGGTTTAGGRGRHGWRGGGGGGGGGARNGFNGGDGGNGGNGYCVLVAY